MVESTRVSTHDFTEDRYKKICIIPTCTLSASKLQLLMVQYAYIRKARLIKNHDHDWSLANSKGRQISPPTYVLQPPSCRQIQIADPQKSGPSAFDQCYLPMSISALRTNRASLCVWNSSASKRWARQYAGFFFFQKKLGTRVTQGMIFR